MSDVDISAETVERLAIDYDDQPPCASNCGCSPACGVRSVASCICTRTAATLRALRAALDAAEKKVGELDVAWFVQTGKRRSAEIERDAAQAALLAAQARADAAEHALNMERARVHECRTIQREMARDIQALQPPAALDAAWRRAVAAAAEWLEDRGEQVSIGTAAEFSYCVSRIRALQPPADLAAQAARAPGDAVALTAQLAAMAAVLDKIYAEIARAGA